MQKKSFFSKKICVFCAGNALSFSETAVPSNAAWLFIAFGQFRAIPPKLCSLNAANIHFFYAKMRFFLKKFAYLHFL